MANELAGLCDICGKAGKMASCVNCGSLVCILHHDPESGMCTECRRGKKMCKR